MFPLLPLMLPGATRPAAGHGAGTQALTALHGVRELFAELSAELATRAVTSRGHTWLSQNLAPQSCRQSPGPVCCPMGMDGHSLTGGCCAPQGLSHTEAVCEQREPSEPCSSASARQSMG